MGITCNFDDVLRQLDGIKEKLLGNLNDAFAEAGEEAVARIMETRTYKDRTGSLTASIGYGVVDNGEIVREGGFGSGEGGKKGREVLREAAGSLKGGHSLIIVAGMEYAIYVERRGFVVLDGGTIGLDKEVESIIQRTVQ